MAAARQTIPRNSANSARSSASSARSKPMPTVTSANVAYGNFRSAMGTSNGTSTTRPGQDVLDDAAALGATVATTDPSVPTEPEVTPSFGSFTSTVNDPADPDTKVGFGLLQMIGLPDTLWVSATTGIPLDYPLVAAGVWFGSKWLGWR